MIKRFLKSKRRNINRCCHLKKTFQRLYVANQIVDSQNEGQAALQPLLPLLQNKQRAPHFLQPTAITPSNYATPQSSITGQDAKSHIPLPETPSSSRRDPVKVDLDDGFDRHDVDNLLELKLPLPSEVYETDTISQTLDKIKTYNKSIGQYSGIDPSSKKISNAEKINWNHREIL